MRCSLPLLGNTHLFRARFPKKSQRILHCLFWRELSLSGNEKDGKRVIFIIGLLSLGIKDPLSQYNGLICRFSFGFYGDIY